MSKQEESWYTTSLELGEIKQILASVLVRAEINELQGDPLNELPEFAILAEQRHAPFKKPKFGSGLAAAQILVHDGDDERRIQFIALGTSVGASVTTAFAAEGSYLDRVAAQSVNPVFKSSKRMVAALVQALTAADPHFRHVG